jgi:general secretion pathway protein C
MPRQIHILFNLLALFVIIYIVVNTFYRLVGIELHQMSGQKVVMLEGVESYADRPMSAPEYDTINERNIFGATEKAESLPVEDKTELIETLEETTLQLALLGTIAGDSESARAIILDQKNKKQDIYRVGDSVQNAEIRQILRGKVILRHGENDEILTMVENSAKVQPKTGTPPEEVSEVAEEIVEEVIPITREELQGTINDLNQLMTQVRIRPYFRQGKPQGLIVSQIQTDSIFEKLGLMNGDIIASVNGEQMSSPEEAFQLYNSLNSGSQVSIEITRRGQKKTLTYDIRE